jgi:hypothetical protein
MDALFAREVQFSVRTSGKLFAMPKGLKTNPPSGRRTNQAAAWKKMSLKNLQAGISAEFSKPQISLPDREFESVPLRQTTLFILVFIVFPTRDPRIDHRTPKC